MSRKVTKDIALTLIPFVKKIECVANMRRPKSKSCIEFAKQMMSANLKKKNPTLECDMFFHDEDIKPFIKVEFSDGSKWHVETDEMTAVDLRADFYAKAEAVEEAAEEADGDFSMDEGGAGKGKGAKPAAKPAGKK